MNLTIEYIDNLAYELMGSSDFYDYRVCESCTITYIDKDIYAEQIKF
jgi:Zn-dependent alcohol dehydrogenase